MMYDLEKLGLGWYLRPHRHCFPAAQETRALQGAVNVTTGRGKCHSPSDFVVGSYHQMLRAAQPLISR
jgi:hypothetical protein